MLTSILTPGMEIKGSKLGFWEFSSHKINNLLTYGKFTTKPTHQYFHSIFFYNFFFFENLKLTKNN